MEYTKMNPLEQHLNHIASTCRMPQTHLDYLAKLKKDGYDPKVIYDIGSCVLHWTNEAKRLWGNSKYVLFDAFEPVEYMYKGYDYHIGVLSDENDKEVKFFQNDLFPGGNSYYREVGSPTNVFPEDLYLLKTTRTLDSVIEERGFPWPDLIKLDVQGAELDVLRGAPECLKHANMLIAELQNVNYNDGAPQSKEVIEYLQANGWTLKDALFCNNGPDGDYCFVKDDKA